MGDVPLLGEVRQLLRFYQAVGKDTQIFYNYMLQAASPHQIAAALIAIRIETGSFGYGDSGWQRNKLTDQGFDLATRLYDDVVGNLHRGFERKKVSRNYDEPKIVTDLSNIIVLSDKARGELRAEALESGHGYKGARMIRAKTNYDNGCYEKLSGQNVIYYRR